MKISKRRKIKRFIRIHKTRLKYCKYFRLQKQERVKKVLTNSVVTKMYNDNEKFCYKNPQESRGDYFRAEFKFYWYYIVDIENLTKKEAQIFLKYYVSRKSNFLKNYYGWETISYLRYRRILKRFLNEIFY